MTGGTAGAARRRVVLAGGGHAHALLLRAIADRPFPRAALTLVSDAELAPYSGMLPGLIAGDYSHREAHIDLPALCRRAGARFVLAPVRGLDLGTRTLLLDGDNTLPYDVLSVNTGSTPSTGGVPGADTYATPAKPVPRLLRRWAEIVRGADENPQSDPPSIAVVGGGAGGVELALAIHRRLAGRVRLSLLQSAPHILPDHNPRVREVLAATLFARSVAVHARERVTAVGAGGLTCASGREFAAGHVFWITHAAAPDWPREAGLAVDPNGFILTADTLRSISHPEVFAAGDVATVAGHPRPKSGVYAVRQARPLEDNLRRHLAGRPLRPYRPQRAALSLIGTADGRAVLSWRSLAWRSRFAWHLKQGIDRRFVRRLNEAKVRQ